MTKTKQKRFYEPSRRFGDQLGDLFQFVHGSTAALWTLRTSVSGFLAQVDGPVGADLLKARFVDGSGLSVDGENIRNILSDSWSDQLKRFAMHILVEQGAYYEGWCESMAEVLQPHLAKNQKWISKNLQFPTSTVDGQKRGISAVIEAATSGTDSKNPNFTFIGKYITPTLFSANLDHIEDLARCYRYFKEIRNSYLHSGIANSSLAEAASSYIQRREEIHNNETTVAEFKAMGVSRLPVATPISVGDQISVELYEVIGFTKILLVLVAYLDARLAIGPSAVHEITMRWAKRWGADYTALNGVESRSRSRKARSHLAQLGSSHQAPGKAAAQFLEDTGCIRRLSRGTF